MTTLNIVLICITILVLTLYITDKLKDNNKLNLVVKEVKEDLQDSVEVLKALVTKATDIVFDESVHKVVKEFILLVEEKNLLAKEKGEVFLKGDEKKLEVIRRLSQWVSNITGSTKKALTFIETNESKIDSIIEDYISFTNKMSGKSTLSEAEKLISEKLHKDTTKRL